VLRAPTVLAQFDEEGSLSTPAVRTELRSRPSAGARARSLPTRAITVFSGTVGFVLKVVFLSIVNALAVWAMVVLLDHHKWRAVVVLIAATVILDAIYLVRRWTLPLKFLIPGTLFLLAFHIIPVGYTINVAFTNYSTGHILSRSEAIRNIQENSLTESANGATYAMTLMRDDKHHLVLGLLDESGRAFVGTEAGLRRIPGDQVTVSDGTITAVQGYSPLKGTELGTIDKELSAFKVPVGGGRAIEPQGFDTALVLEPTYRYDRAANTFTRIKDDVVFNDNGRGSYVAANGEEIEPGWKTYVGGRNFGRIIHNPLIRNPFLKVFLWTMFFAISVVFISFALGLFLAITLNKPGLSFLRTYRALLIIPMAVPAFLSLLVWQGLLNDDFGVVNGVFHSSIPWLFDPNWARVSVILVSVWLGVPYFFLVCLGALQSIPNELVEAAHVDGGGAWQVFRKVTLPLLLISVAPLMIASFAFNFNNFGNIYLLTGGGPALDNSPVAGATDILISYTYKLAFAAGKGQDYGLASAIAIIIFFIVGTISAISFSRTKALENLA
jgi:arabinogalactan oligomer/maltooligosaccharide transport system permease protein